MEMQHAVDALYQQRNNFIIIGLTGRTGSGCSTVASFLPSEIGSIISEKKSIGANDTNEDRKKNIVKDFIVKNWEPFFAIRARDVISTFILSHDFVDVVNFARAIVPGVDFEPIKGIFLETQKKAACLLPVLDDRHGKADATLVHEFMASDIGRFTGKVKDFFDEMGRDRCFKIYQTVGDNIRLYGNALGLGNKDGGNIYTISEAINRIIKSLRDYNKAVNRKDYFVIDAFRNPIEVKFFQERFSAFYLWAINSTERDRKDRLLHFCKMKIDEVCRLDKKEYPNPGFLKEENAFVSQNIAGCIQAADVQIINEGALGTKDFGILHDQMLKYVALIKRPGLITPSRDERCMQVACTAKLNSGCISRQVGAVVADENGFVRAIGWNDAPRGQTPCLLKTCFEFVKKQDRNSYSKYEIETGKFVECVKEFYCIVRDESEARGVTPCFCFKDIKNIIDREKNQVYTRSLHAEENAFLALVNGSGCNIRGGTLYTTASPCVLCAKKAYQLGVRRVVYVDPYPDISFEHVFESGLERPVPVLYSGALGAAYHKLYQPIVPLKDELSALSI